MEPPTLNDLATPAPPGMTREPVETVVEFVALVI